MPFNWSAIPLPMWFLILGCAIVLISLLKEIPTPWGNTELIRGAGRVAVFVLGIVIIVSSLFIELFPPNPPPPLIGSTPTPTTHMTPGPGLLASPMAGTQEPSQGCGGAFSDAFRGSLDSRWKWKDPSSKATRSMTTDGPLSLTTPPNSDISPYDNNYNAPRLLQPITGNFTIDTRVSFRPHTNFQSAGLLVGQMDQTTFLRFERGFGGYGKDSGVLFQRVDHGSLSDVSTLKQNPTIAGSVELRIQRQGNGFTASWREQPDQTWQFAGETELHFDSQDSLMVGLDVIADYGAPQTTASYDYFMVSCP
jgi:regulation of enolase protein 1 (concanavalin A-like superfamily)